MNYKLQKIYKVNSKNEIILVFSLNCKEYKLYIDKNNIKYLSKTLKHSTIDEALLYWKKKEKHDTKLKKKEINEEKLKYILQNFEIEYNFIGKYLLNIKFGENNYIIDFISNNIETFTILESYDNQQDTETESSVNLVKNIEKINLFNSNNLSDELKKLLNFTINNTEILKPVLSLINSKTDNMVENIFKSSGFDINLSNNVNTDKILNDITSYLKIIEDLNNNNISEIKSNEETKFNFLISEIWNQLKNIIDCLNKMSPNDDYDKMLNNYKENLDELRFSQNNNSNLEIQNIIIQNIINNISGSIFNNFFKFMESKYLELNLLLQNFDKSQDNKLLDKKVCDILLYTNNLHKIFFFNIIDESDVTNIFSNFNKLNKLSNIIISLEKEAKGFLILKMSNYQSKKTFSFELLINNVKQNILNNELNSKETNELILNTSNVIDKNMEIDEIYKKFNNLLKIVYPTNIIFKENINELYNEQILILKKKQLSNLLVKFHEEIKFKVSIITKVISKD
tara:strand:- start:1854 stop:3389 length:1536 start_codon:yes stop_codon:yes gene_type:complete